ncbi:MAG: alpha/beta hydrolase-fold protein [Bacteroidales bacterium]
MKKLTLISLALWCGVVLNTNAQNYIRIDTSFYSQALDEVKMINVYLPVDYYQNPEQEYAVIYYLHAANGNQNSSHTYAKWYYDIHVEDTTITSPPAIFVGPNGDCQPYAGSLFVNSELYGNYEDYVMQDVIGFIENNYRVIQDKNFRLITGTSMGGFGSANLSTTYPDQFRAAFPYIGFPSMPDTTLETWKNLYYLEQGSYFPDCFSGGFNTSLLCTMCGGLSPNVNNPPNYVDFPFDILGNWIDDVLDRWYEHDASRKVKDLPDENELAWFLACGTVDYMCTYPAYLQFMDSLDFYGISYDYYFFEDGHIFYLPAWEAGVHWMDSIINLSFMTIGITDIEKSQGYLAVYPNPVFNQLNLTYHVTQPGMVNIRILDQQGRQVAEVLNAYQERGTHQKAWRMGSQAAGLYLIRMQTANTVMTKKIIKY